MKIHAKKPSTIIITIILVTSLLVNGFFILKMLGDQASHSISGTYEAGENPMQKQYVAIAQKEKSQYETYLYKQNEQYQKGTLKKLTDNVYILRFDEHDQVYYIVNDKDKITLIIKNHAYPYKKIANHLAFYGIEMEK